MLCFIATVVNIYRAQPADSDIAASTDRNMAIIFAKICGLMGITWLFALVPYITGIEEFWYVFVITNGLQGLYIFLSSGIPSYLKNKCSVQSILQEQQTSSHAQSKLTTSQGTDSVKLRGIDEARM